ncbi:hypothetical protein JST99_03830 [Candidatus Dependentiae bacterium]|nr:hypothetical protein [Candidatus Dependentiae bacterium]
MFEMYERLSDKNKGIIQIILGLSVVLYIFGVLPWWIALVSGALVAVYGCFTAGFYETIHKAIKEANKKH